MTAPAIRVVPLRLATVEPPPAHPRAAEGTTVVFGFVLLHPDGPIVVDTGVGTGHDRLDELYHPVVVPLPAALAGAGVDAREVVALVNTHLHFDHCGQNSLLAGVPVWVQAAEVAASRLPRYTVPEWAEIPPADLRAVDGDADLVEGVRLVATPGHTPGHQSVVVDGPGGPVVIAGQACHTAAEFVAGQPADADAHDAEHAARARRSVARLQAIEPAAVYFSHDPTVLRRP